jgi:hypothetical protein
MRNETICPSSGPVNSTRIRSPGSGPHEWIAEGLARPSKDELKFDEARAIAMMKAGTLYRLTWREGAVPGCIRRRLDNDKRSRTTELRFDTVEFMGWGVVFKAYFKKK